MLYQLPVLPVDKSIIRHDLQKPKGSPQLLSPIPTSQQHQTFEKINVIFINSRIPLGCVYEKDGKRYNF
jgi:hypothetical protein